MATPTDTSDGVFTVTASGPGQVILNEILANEPGSSTGGRVHRAGERGRHLHQHRRVDARGTRTLTRHTFASGTTLAPGKAIVVFAGASAIPAGATNAVAASTGSLSSSTAAPPSR